jgi:hypothetical protein
MSGAEANTEFAAKGARVVIFSKATTIVFAVLAVINTAPVFASQSPHFMNDVLCGGCGSANDCPPGKTCHLWLNAAFYALWGRVNFVTIIVAMAWLLLAWAVLRYRLDWVPERWQWGIPNLFLTTVSLSYAVIGPGFADVVRTLDAVKGFYP